MRSKIKHFSRLFKNPAYVLVLLVSLAVVGAASAVAIRAFADGAPAGYELYHADHIYYLDGQATKAKIMSGDVTIGNLHLTSDYVPGSPITADKLADSNGTKLSEMDGFKDHTDELTYRIQIDDYDSLDCNVYFSCTVNGTTYTTVYPCYFYRYSYDDINSTIDLNDAISELRSASDLELEETVIEEALHDNGQFWSSNYTGSEKYSVGSGITYYRLFTSVIPAQLSIAASYPTESQYGSDISLTYNSEGNFSYTTSSVDLPFPEDDDATSSYQIVFYNGDTKVKSADLPQKIIMEADNSTTQILSVYGSDTCLYGLDGSYNKYNSTTGVYGYLPMSVKMVYDYSNYPEKGSAATSDWGYTDVGNLLGSVNRISDIYQLSYSDPPVTSESFTLADSGSSPTFTPPHTENKTCPTSYWVLKNHLDYNYSPGNHISVSQAQSAGVLTEPAFNAATGYYECEFPVEPLFEECFFRLDYHENYWYNYAGVKEGLSDNDKYELYRYQYMNGNTPIPEPPIPTITVKSPGEVNSNITYNHKYETFQYWTENADGTGTQRNANTTWQPTAIRDIDLYAQWEPKVYHITYDFQSPTGSVDNVTVKGNWGYSGSYHNQQEFTGFQKELRLSVDKAQTEPSDIYNRDFLSYAVNTQQIGETYYSNIKLACSDGSTFKYWSLSPRGSQVYSVSENNFTQSADGEYYVTVYAVWDGVTIQYNNNGKWYASNMPDSTIIPVSELDGDGYTLSTQIPTATNCVFKGWMLTSDGSDTITALTKAQAATQLGHDPAVGNTVTVYAKWEEAKTLTYYANEPSGATYTGTVPAAESFESGETATVKGNVGASGDGSEPLAITGYVFSGWNTAADGSGDSYAAGAEITMNSNVDLYAQWTAITYRLTYNANSGTLTDGVSVSGMPSPATVDLTVSDFTYTLTTDLPTAFAYKCLGWGSSPNITTADRPTVTLDNFAMTNVTLYECTAYAIWEKTPYVLHYNANKPTGMGDVTGDLSDVNLTIDHFTKNGEDWIYSNLSKTLSTDGFTFKGWNPDSNAVEKVDQLNVATAFTDTDSDGTYEATVYAVWTENGYQLHYDSNGHSAATGIPADEDDLVYCSGATETKNVKDGKALSDSVPSDTGYRFTGWRLNDGTELQPGETVAFDKFKASSTVTATAQWETVTNQVIYHVNTAAIGTDATVTNWLASGLDDYTADFNITDANLNAAKNQYTLLAPSPVPATAGYLFRGWSATGGAYTDQTEINTIDVSFTTTAQTYDVYAMWDDFGYRLAYDLNGHTDATNQPDPNPSEHLLSEVRLNKVEISTNIPTVAGYTFTGWKIGETVYSAADIAAAANPSVTDEQKAKLIVPGTLFSDATKSATAVAQWTELTYTLQYEDNAPGGATVEGMPTTNPVTGILYSAVKDGTYTLASAPTAIGHTFQGWKLNDTATLDAGAGIPFENFDNGTRTATATAQWDDIAYTLTYDANVPTGATLASGTVPASASSTYGESVTVAGNTGNMVVTGYTFGGWNTKADGSGDAKAAGSSVTMTSDVTLYAQWTELTYTLQYEDNAPGGATVENMPTTPVTGILYSAVKDGNYLLASSAPTAEGHTFKGWKLNQTSGNQDAGAGIPFENFDNGTRTATATAQWDDIAYTLTYDANVPTGATLASGTVPASASSTYGESVTVAGNTGNMVVTGYTFGGWNTKADGSGDAKAAGSSVTMTSDVTLYAQWTELTYTLQYEDNAPGGATVEGMPATPVTGILYSAVKDGNYALASSAPTAEGYTFKGWKLNVTDGVKDAGAGIPFENFNNNERTATATAQWQAISTTYTVIYKDNTETYTDLQNPSSMSNGTVTGITAADVSAGYVLRGETAETFPTSDNYRFVYWCTTKAYDSSKIVTTATADDFRNDLDGDDMTLTVYAHWVRKIEVTYQSETTQEDDNGNVEIVSAKEAFEVNVEDLSYTVKSLAEIKRDRPDFEYPTDRDFVKWRVLEGGDQIKIVSASGSGSASGMPVSGGNLMPRRSGAGTGTVVEYLTPGSHVLIHGDVVLMAVWNKYYVSYDANGASAGSVPAEPTIYPVGSNVTVLANTGSLSRTGATFKGWNTKSDYTGTHYSATGSETFSMPEEDVVLYAQWQAIPGSDPDPTPSGGSTHYTVTYDANGGTGTTPKDTIEYVGGETVIVASKGDLVKAGCTFKEWNTASNGSGTGYKGDGTDTFTMPKSNVTLYAIWVDSDGNIVIPTTGENDLPLQLAFNLAILSLLAFAFTAVIKHRKEADA